MFNYLYKASNGVIELSEIEDIVNKFEVMGDSILTELASKTREITTPTINLNSKFNR